MATEQTLRDWLTLVRLPGIGPSAAAEIRRHYDSPAAFLDASEAHRQRKGIRPPIVQAPRGRESVQAGVEADLAWQADADDRHIVTLDQPNYPASLARIADPPPVLFVRGDLAALATPQLAIVGSRHATPGGLHSAGDFAAHLAATGLTITSGLALGIDAEAHQGALAAGGQTIAVMATGPDRLYPRENQALAHEIAAAGAVVTEMPTGTPVVRGLFPRRNRLISGLSLGVLVIEAGLKSGALSTAYAALEQGREALALPGSIHNPVARGCHRLIRNGARLVETADHVVEELRSLADALTLELPDAGPAVGAANATSTDTGDAPAEALDADYQKVLKEMGHDPISFDRLAERVGLTADILSSMLLSLELKGYVTPCNGGRYMRADNRTGG